MSCKAFKPYLISDYLNKLAYQSGICLSQEINESFNELLKWNIVEEEDKQYINEDLNYIFLYTTIGKLLEIDDIKSFIENNKWISNRKDNDLVIKEGIFCLANVYIMRYTSSIFISSPER
ncbi:MAG: hypothetical protein Q4F12_03875 [Erysipelotrichaceae bacterium]|nr:hypothetical protein [Erysipelotrichaceae bacterium]